MRFQEYTPGDVTAAVGGEVVQEADEDVIEEVEGDVVEEVEGDAVGEVEGDAVDGGAVVEEVEEKVGNSGAGSNKERGGEEDERTLFMGNVPVAMEVRALKKHLLTLLRPHNLRIASLRFRSIPVASISKPRRVAIANKEYNPNRQSKNAYIVFSRVADATAALSVLQAETVELDGKVAQFDTAVKTVAKDESMCVFVGNLPFDAEDQDVRAFFAPCGSITSVRLIRDKATNIGKGFGYVQFSSPKHVKTALTLHGTFFHKRQVRVFKANHSKSQTKATGAPYLKRQHKRNQTSFRGQEAAPPKQHKKAKRHSKSKPTSTPKSKSK